MRTNQFHLELDAYFIFIFKMGLLRLKTFFLGLFILSENFTSCARGKLLQKLLVFSVALFFVLAHIFVRLWINIINILVWYEATKLFYYWSTSLKQFVIYRERQQEINSKYRCLFEFYWLEPALEGNMEKIFETIIILWKLPGKRVLFYARAIFSRWNINWGRRAESWVEDTKLCFPRMIWLKLRKIWTPGENKWIMLPCGTRFKGTKFLGQKKFTTYLKHWKIESHDITN